MMSRGVFMVSIDYEGAWGVADRSISAAAVERILREADITRRLIALFEKYKIPATWAVVGRLLTDEGKNQGSLWGDTEELIAKIAGSVAGHEIGSHSYGHVLYGSISEDAARRDVAAAQEIHRAHGLPFQSFVFPRNDEGHHAVLVAHGIQAFRHTTRRWFSSLPWFLRVCAQVVDYYLPLGRSGVPSRHASGLLSIPDSMLLDWRKGLRRIILPSRLVAKARQGLLRAAQRRELFHLWLHPSNFSYDTETQFTSFEKILAYAAQLREEGQLDILTMRELTAQYTHI